MTSFVSRSRPLRWSLIALVAMLASGLAACGGPSAAEKAKTEACDAIDGIRAEVAKVRALPVAASSIGPAGDAGAAIRDDLATIERVAPDLDRDQFAEALDQARTSFRTSLDAAVNTVLTTGDLTALSGLGTALEDSFTTAFKDVGC